MVGRGFACAGALAAAVVMSGCLANGSASVKSRGQYVSSETLGLIDAGVSTERELLDLLGSPTRTMRHHDGRVVHVYAYELDSRASGGVFLLATGKARRSVEKTTFFEVTGGVVSRYWTDGPSEFEERAGLFEDGEFDFGFECEGDADVEVEVSG